MTLTKRRSFIKKLTISSALTCALGPNLNLFAQVSRTKIFELKELLRNTQSTLILPGESFAGESFSQSTSSYNLSIKNNSEMVLIAKDREGIQETIRWAKDNHIKLRMRCSGHSYEGFSSGPGIVINTSSMTRIKVDTQGHTAYIEAGNRLINVIKELSKYGYAIPTGTCPSVGIAGLTLGGGVGMTTRKWGLTCDNLLAVHMILADGQSVRATATDYPDLFWACQGGGGGNLAVITAFEFNLKKLPYVYTFAIKWHQRDMEQSLSDWQDFLTQMPDEMSSVYKVTINKNGVLHGKSVGQIIINNELNSKEDILEMLGPILKAKPESFKLEQKSYLESVKYFGGDENGSPVRFKAKSHYMKRRLLAWERRTLRACSEYIPSGSTVAIIFDSLGGAVKNKESSDSAFVHRDALCSVQYYCQWYKDSDATKNKTMMKNIYKRVEPIFGPHSYVNYCDLDLRNWGYRYYGDNLEKLISIKRQYDPGSLFDYGAQCLSRFN